MARCPRRLPIRGSSSSSSRPSGQVRPPKSQAPFRRKPYDAYHHPRHPARLRYHHPSRPALLSPMPLRPRQSQASARRPGGSSSSSGNSSSARRPPSLNKEASIHRVGRRHRRQNGRGDILYLLLRRRHRHHNVLLGSVYLLLRRHRHRRPSFTNVHKSRYPKRHVLFKRLRNAKTADRRRKLIAPKANSIARRAIVVHAGVIRPEVGPRRKKISRRRQIMDIKLSIDPGPPPYLLCLDRSHHPSHQLPVR